MNTMDQQQAECFIIIKCKIFIMYFIFFSWMDDSLPRQMDGQEDNDEKEREIEWKKIMFLATFDVTLVVPYFFPCVFLPGILMS